MVVHPTNHEKILFHCQRGQTIRYRCADLPRLGDVIRLSFKVSVGKKKAKHTQMYHVAFRVVEVQRNITALTPTFESGLPPTFDEYLWYNVSVVPVTKAYSGTIRLMEKFYKETYAKHQHWFNARVKANKAI